MYAQPPKKKAKWLWFVGGGCLVLLLASCAIFTASGMFAAKTASNSVDQAIATVNTASTVIASVTVDTGSSSSTSATAGGTIVKPGQMITVNDVQCTLTAVTALAGDDINTPKAGYQYIMVHVTMKNASGNQVDYNPFDFHVKSSKGNVTDADFAQPQSYTGNNILNSGRLDPGGSVDGDIIFQAPVGDKGAELTWSASIFSSNTQYGWKLGTY
jgi:hypothetical protein